ncbi:MAG TPA: hypothetical protein PKJ14_03400 [Candidatus Cloacimonadota bacterium]|nr:hypothetical protein [Candidatus Cloacimonadota bacterium]HQL14597.1 hypothetical protein [Candidatus Cloacimonadota bacterium]
MDATSFKSNRKATLTLAKLFEAQNQWQEALAIYSLIYETDPSPELNDKIESLQKRILDDPNLHYEPEIEKLFSPDELMHFKIIKHGAFENIQRTRQQLTAENSDYNILLEDDEPLSQTQKPNAELEKVLDEIAESSENSAQADERQQGTPTIDDFVQELALRFGKDKKMTDISVQDFLQLLEEYNLLSGFFKKA